jgi:glucoamylase
VFDAPPQSVERYARGKTESSLIIWRFNHKCRKMPSAKTLRIETLSPATVHWSADGWKEVHDSGTKDSGLGLHYTDLPTEKLIAGTSVLFTFHWQNAGRWEGVNFEVRIE